MTHVADNGIIADGSVDLSGHHIAGRDYYEGLVIRTRMRQTAKTCLRSGALCLLAGLACVGYYVVAFNLAVNESVQAGFDNPDVFANPDLPPFAPLVPIGSLLTFVGIVLLVVGLCVPRDRHITRGGRTR